MSCEEVQTDRCLFASCAYYYAKMNGLVPFTLKNGKVSRGSPCDRAYSWVLIAWCILGCVTLCVSFAEELTTKTLNHNSVFRLSMQGAQNLAIAACLVHFLTKQDRATDIIEALSKIDTDLQSLRANCNDTPTFGRLAVIALIYSSCVNVAQLYFLYQVLGAVGIGTSVLVFQRELFYASTRSIQRTVLLSFAIVVTLVGHRIQRIAATLLHVGDRRRLVAEIHPIEGNRAEEDATCESRDPTMDPGSALLEYQRMAKLHFDVYQVMERIVDLFSFPLLVIVLPYVGIIISHCVELYDIATDVDPKLKNDPVHASGEMYLLWLTVLITELYATTAACQGTRDEARAVTFVFHKMWNKHHLSKLRGQTLIFAMQLIHVPLNISPYGIVSLDLSFLQKIIWTTLSYSIVIIQFGMPRTGSSIAVKN